MRESGSRTCSRISFDTNFFSTQEGNENGRWRECQSWTLILSVCYIRGFMRLWKTSLVVVGMISFADWTLFVSRRSTVVGLFDEMMLYSVVQQLTKAETGNIKSMWYIKSFEEGWRSERPDTCVSAHALVTLATMIGAWMCPLLNSLIRWLSTINKKRLQSEDQMDRLII